MAATGNAASNAYWAGRRPEAARLPAGSPQLASHIARKVTILRAQGVYIENPARPRFLHFFLLTGPQLQFSRIEPLWLCKNHTNSINYNLVLYPRC